MMTNWRRSLLASPKLLWSAIIPLAVLDSAGLYLLFSPNEPAPAQAPPAAQFVAPTVPLPPPPPAMIHPMPAGKALQSGTLIVISKPSQAMYVFSGGSLWASSPVSTGKHRHTTPSGVFPILQKRKMHRSNIYSGAPMPWMQRLTWDGIALHAGWVPGYPASHGCVRVPPAFAQALFSLTSMSATTVVIGDDPLPDAAAAQSYALTAQLPIRSALAPPSVLIAAAKQAIEAASGRIMTTVIAGPVPEQAAASPSAPLPPTPPPTTPTPAPPAQGETIQLAAAASQAEAEAHWARLLSSQPELSRYAKTIEAVSASPRPLYRLRLSGTDAHNACLKLKSAGISCFNVS